MKVLTDLLLFIHAPSRCWYQRFAHSYPDTPNAAAREACENFIHAIPYMLPCTMCGLDFLDFITNNKALSGTFDDRWGERVRWI